MSSTTIFSDISIAATLAFDLPAAIAAIEAVLPQATTETRSLLQTVLTPGKAIVADVKAIFAGGNATVLTEDAQKTLADLMALFTAATTVIPAAKADVSGVWSSVAPALQPIARAVGIALPSAIFASAAPAAASASTGTTATASAS